jgi:hypothetical protein
MLLHVLVRLRCARAAALTSSLSCRWRGLWTRLFELSFREIPLEAVEAALQQVACPALSRLEIQIPVKIMDPARVAALLHAAARLSPAALVFDVSGNDSEDHESPVEIPCFQRATSIELRVANLRLTLPAEFPVLERLWVDECRFDNMAELVSRCPRLRVLQVWRCPDFVGTVKVHSPTIEELALEVMNWWLCNLDIVAPMLKKLTLLANAGKDFSLFFSAPVLEHLVWRCSFYHRNVGIGEKWCVRWLHINTVESTYQLMLDIAFQVHPLCCSIYLTIQVFMLDCLTWYT